MEELNKTIRIKTTPGGDDKHLTLKVEQSFDFLEVLSLKISQEDLYANFCSNYGVIIGRVIANKGFGVPNSKVSVFIPISSEDEKNLLLKNLYPYKSTTDKNDGVRYNLLLNRTTCVLNKAVGTFPDKETLLTNDLVIEVFEKYYKYTTKTNESGDFMLFGVPVGERIIHMDADLSDAGLLSVRPYDLISQGAPVGFFDSYSEFKASKNLDTLPQIKTSNQSVDVIPFWGDPETCELGITRVDIDTNTELEPTALFIGSVFSDKQKNSINKRCNPKNDQGELPELRTGAGKINFIRANKINIVEWVQNKDIVPTDLEFFDVDGGDVIDEDGTFVITLPMNVGRVVTNEVGDIVPSEDPEAGLPTKGLYRMKMSFNEPPSNRKRRTANMLVPSLCTDLGGTPGYTSTGQLGDRGGTEDQRFTDNISDYSSINAPDSIFKDFHLFEWKQLYTIAQYIKKYKKGNNRWSFLGLKNTDMIEGSGNSPMPFNTAVKKPDFLFGIGSFFLKIGAAFMRMMIILIGLQFGFYLGFKIAFTIFGTDFCILRFYTLILITPFGWIGDLMGKFCNNPEEEICCEILGQPSCDSGCDARGYALECGGEPYCIQTNGPPGSLCGTAEGPPCNGCNGCGSEYCDETSTTASGRNCEGGPVLTNGFVDVKQVCGCPTDTSISNLTATDCEEKVFCMKGYSFTPNANTCDAINTINEWLCCKIIELAEKRNVIRRCFFDAWIVGTSYLFQYKYKSKLKKKNGELIKKEKFCGPGSDTKGGNNYHKNKCCPHDNAPGNECAKCLIRGGEESDKPISNVSNYHRFWHNNTVNGDCGGYTCGNGATDIDDNIYCNTYNSTKIVSLGRTEMCLDTLNEIEKCINKLECVFDLYKQSPEYFTGTFYEDGWDINFWSNDMTETSYQDPIDVLKYLISTTSCSVNQLFDHGGGCHENELKNEFYQWVKEVSKIYNEIIIGQVSTSTTADQFLPGAQIIANVIGAPPTQTIEYDEDDNGFIYSGYIFDDAIGQRFSPCGGPGGGAVCSQPPAPWIGQDTQSNDPASGPGTNNNASKNIPYYYFGLIPGRTAIEKLRNKFFVN